MPGPNLLSPFIGRLNRVGLPYIVTGAVASAIYGEPRLTHDIDLVVMMKKEDIKSLLEAFPPKEFYCPPEEVLRIEVGRPHRGHFNLIHHETGTRADVYLSGKDELHEWALSRRRKVVVEGEQVWVAPPEYVIIRKLEYFREGGSEKHLRDIAGMLELSLRDIDLKQLEAFVDRYGFERVWQRAKAMAGS